jgi:hypothetical protein
VAITGGKSAASQANGLLTVSFAILVTAAALRGFQVREEFYLAPDHGLGYALGIIGGSLMLALLLYPLRKNLRFMRGWGATRHWFRLHMLLGIVGPLCILFHCNFSLGAVNSNMALLCMGLMVASGLVGRYIYTRIHYGLYGERANLQDLQRGQLLEAALLREDEARYGSDAVGGVIAEMKTLEPFTLPVRGPLGGLWRIAMFAVRSRQARWRIRAHLKGFPPASAQDAARLSGHIERYLDTLRRITGFSFFERLFSFWHALHLPIFFMLLVTGLVHVWAVNNY